MVRKLIKALLSGSVLIPTLGFGLGLGDIHLRSGLNQQLNAEIELLSVEPAEVDKVGVALASYETFAKVGVERPSVLSLISFEVRKRANGTPYILVRSQSPINEPFLDFLLEVRWPTGQVLREYTLLLDPPEMAGMEPAAVATPLVTESTAVFEAPLPVEPMAPAAAAAPESALSAEPAAATTPEPLAATTAEPGAVSQPLVAPQLAPASEQQPAEPSPKPVKAVSVAEALAALQVQPAPADAMVYGPVKSRDTLYRIAERLRPNDQVTMEQMMVALYNNNRAAFVQGNINRLRKGAVLRIDDPAAVTALSQAEARREVTRHNRAWQQYRSNLAASTPKAAAGDATVAAAKPGLAAGSAVAPTEEPKLTLVAPSKEAAKQTTPGGTAAKGAEADSLRKELLLANESAVARRKENEELNKRLKELEGQLDSMQKLLSLKDDNLAAMQQKLAATQPAPAAATTQPAQSAAVISPAVEPAKPAVEPAKPAVEPAKPAVEPAKPAVEAAKSAVEAAKSAVETAKSAVETAKTAEPVVPTSEPSVAVAPTVPTEQTPADASANGAAAPAAAEQAPVEAPAKPKPVAKPRPKPVMPPPPPETSFIDDLLANPVMLGGGVAGVVILILAAMMVMRKRRQGRGFQESILTVGATSSMMAGKGENPASETSFLSDLAVSGMGSRVHEESDVDPLTEADVYMAYNRFQQAEELLKEGLKHNPERAELHAKLLEVYYKAKNRKAFELLAEERSTSMQNNDALWQKVMAMGHELCPDNPLFKGAAASGSGAAAAFGTAAQPSSTASNDVFDIGLDLDALSSEMEEAGAGGSAFNVDLGLDFSDLGMESAPMPASAAPVPAEFDRSARDELAAEQPLAAEPVTQEENLLNDFDFDLSAMAEESPTAAEPAASLDFGDIDLGSFATETAEAEEPAATLDFGDLDLGASVEDANSFDLGSLDLGGASDETSFDIADLGELGDDESLGGMDEIGTKLDLAKAYVDMGDSEGARGMLEEVIQEGSAEQQKQAQELLNQLA